MNGPDVVMARDMTNEQAVAWGAKERALRIADLDAPKTEEVLRAAQENAVYRRKLIGASSAWASRAVRAASRRARAGGDA